MMINIRKALVPVLAALVLAACGDSSTDPGSGLGKILGTYHLTEVLGQSVPLELTENGCEVDGVYSDDNEKHIIVESGRLELQSENRFRIVTVVGGTCQPPNGDAVELEDEGADEVGRYIVSGNNQFAFYVSGLGGFDPGVEVQLATGTLVGDTLSVIDTVPGTDPITVIYVKR